MSATTGSLATHPIAHLLAHFVDTRLTGSVEVTRSDGSDAATITFCQGDIAKIRTRQPVAYLGSVLYELGFINADELNASLLELAKKGQPQGQILVARGSITTDQLATGLREQCLRKVAQLFGYDAASTFVIHENADALAEYGGPEPVFVDPCPAIWRGIRDFPPGDHVRAIIDQLRPLLCRLGPEAEVERFDFQGDELALVEVLAKKRHRISDLKALGILPPVRTELVVYCLAISKQIELVRPAAAPPVAMPTAPPRRSVPPTAASQSGLRPRELAGPGAAPQRSLTPCVPQLSADLAARAEMIRDRARNIGSEDFFARLSVPRDAVIDQIRRQYAACRSVWETLPPELEGMRAESTTILAALAEAYTTLSDSTKREAYAATFLLGRTQEIARDLAESGAANAFDGARLCLARGDFDRALRLARSAHNADPDAAAPLALLAWVEASHPSSEGVDAIRTRIAKLDRAVHADPACEDALHFRWQLHRRVENHAAAMRDLARLVALNPHNIEAVRELRIYEMRVRRGSVKMGAVRESASSGVRSRTQEPAGLFGRLLKK